MQKRSFKQVDVFTDTPYLGNPLAVVLDGSGLSTEDMQHFAAWTNLSETTFLLPPSLEAAAQGADYQVRIFTTAYEMPFAGHPTLGSCHAWLEAGGQPKHPEFIVQQCQVGLVRIRHHSNPIAFAAPEMTRSPVATDVIAELLASLGLRTGQLRASQHLVNGPRYVGLLLDHADTVLAVEPKLAELRASMVRAGISGIGMAAVESTCADHGLIKRSNREARAFAGQANTTMDTVPTGQATPDTQTHLSVRFFANDVMVIEDPVTGSFNASLAQWLIADGLAPATYVAIQGTCLGRRGQVHIERDASGQVWVGGNSVTCVDGDVIL
jgi:PhzF family phenazine biosynthesis protein